MVSSGKTSHITIASSETLLLHARRPVSIAAIIIVSFNLNVEADILKKKLWENPVNGTWQAPNQHQDQIKNAKNQNLDKMCKKQPTARARLWRSLRREQEELGFINRHLVTLQCNFALQYTTL